jgi:hypothetical protein
MAQSQRRQVQLLAQNGRARISVGADNLVTRGKNPFGMPEAAPADTDEGRVPYVRYQQDL